MPETNNKNSGALIPLIIDFSILKSPIDQAKRILEQARIYKNNGGLAVGITYSANHDQTIAIRKRNDAALPSKPLSVGWGSNQAAVMEAMEKLLKTPEYSELERVMYVLPITTCKHAGGVGKVEDKWLDQDLADINHFLESGGVVFGWQNQQVNGERYAIGGGISKQLTDAQSERIQQYLRNAKHNYPYRPATAPANIDAQKAERDKIISPQAPLSQSVASSSLADNNIVSSINSSDKLQDNFISPDALKRIKDIKNFLLEDKKISLAFGERDSKPGSVQPQQVDVSVNDKKIGSFEIQRQKMVTKDKDVYVAIAMIRAFIAAKPGKRMIVTPVDEIAHENFQLAVAALSEELTKNKANILIKAVGKNQECLYSYQPLPDVSNKIENPGISEEMKMTDVSAQQQAYTAESSKGNEQHGVLDKAPDNTPPMQEEYGPESHANTGIALLGRVALGLAANAISAASAYIPGLSKKSVEADKSDVEEKDSESKSSSRPRR